MRQVPIFTVVGNGRLATHICHYFDLLAINYHQWYRSKHTLKQLYTLLSKSTNVLILIKDSQIEPFINANIINKYNNLTLVHCSGCLVSQICYGAHPLQTFSDQNVFTINQYREIPFIIDEHAPDFSELIPGVNNSHYRISAKNKPYYHAMCVLANNFSTLLWQKFFKEMTNRFNICNKKLEPFLQRTFENIISNPHKALTGPISRGDNEVLEKNLQALKGDDFYSIFESVIHQFSNKSGVYNENN